MMALFNVVYKQFVWPNDLDEHASLLTMLHENQHRSDVLYFAESSNFTTHIDDSLKLRISDFIDLYCEEDSIDVRPVEHAGYHVGQYVPVIAQIDPESPVQTVVVTMNLRTFGQDVIYGPNEASLQKATRLAQPGLPLVNRVLTTLNFYDNRSAHERDLLKWKSWIKDSLISDTDSVTFPYPTIRTWCEVPKFPDSSGIENMPYRILADQNIKVYGFHLDESNPMVKSFDQIITIGKEKNLNLIFNILAENVDQADSLLGNNLVWLMRRNRDFLVDRYHNKGAIVVDNLEAVANQHFTDRRVFPTEHYDQTGRSIIAMNVAQAIKELHSKK